jgi:hypothetical protein
MKTSNNTIIKIALVLLIGLFVTQPEALAQKFDSKALAKSLVRIKVTGGVHTSGKDKGKPRGPGYASGFVWQQKDRVVTSLHAMRRGDNIKITVEWTSAPSKEQRGPFDAVPIGINKEADLVLLKINPGRLTLPEWTPLNKTVAREAGDKVMALGYWLNAESWKRMTLQITETQNNKLQDLPKAATETLAGIGIPALDLDIVHFENNSLLPGFSGSPLVDTNGMLVAIGDGGIDNGGKNVSWGIPAKYLNNLQPSNTPVTFPANLDHTPVHYSAEEPPVASNIENPFDKAKTYETADDYVEERMEEISYGQFEFYYTKTRTLGEMLETADNPEYLLELVQSLKALNFDYQDFAYDIYQDINYGVIIAVPFGATLSPQTSEDQSQLLKVDFGDDELNQTYPIVYMYEEGVEEEDLELLNNPAALIDSLTYNLKQAFGNLQIDIEETSISKMSTGGLANVGYYVTNEYGDTTAYNFTKIAMNNNVYLVGMSVLTDYTSEQMAYLSRCADQEIDCQTIDTASPCSQLCTLVNNWMYMLTSVHLTTFANFDADKATLIPGSDFLEEQPQPWKQTTYEPELPPGAQVQNLWVDHNMYDEHNRAGMLIHLQFAIQNLQNIDCSAVAYFYTADGQPLMDYNGQYLTADGQVGAAVNFRPGYSSTEYNDFQMFLPYDELHLESGQWALMFRVNLFDMSTGQVLAASPDIFFNYTTPY